MADAALAWEALLTHWRPHGSDRLLFTAGTCFILEVTFLFGCVVFWLLDALPALFRPWQATFPKAKPQPPAALLGEAWTDHFLSTFIVRPILVWLLYPAFTYCGMRIETAALPTAAAACRQLVLCILIDDTWFYWSHRWLHENRWLYGKVHKQHHRFTATTPVASEFAHPFEDLVSNTGSTVAGPLLLGSHLAIVWVYSFVKLSQTIQAHSGYVLPLPLTAWSLPWGELGGELGRHAFHHSHPNANANFGGYFNWWDRLMGTDKPYLAWVEEKRRERERGGAGGHLE